MPAKKKVSASKKSAPKKHIDSKKVIEEHAVEPIPDALLPQAAVTTSAGQPVSADVQINSDAQSVAQAPMGVVPPQQTAQVDPSASLGTVPPVPSSPVQTPPPANPQAANPPVDNVGFQPAGIANDSVQSQPTMNSNPGGPVIGKPDAIDQSNNTFGPLPEPESRSKLWLFLVVLIVIAALGGGGYFYYSQFMQKGSSDSQKATVTPTEAPESEESTSSAELNEVKLDEYTVKVLNGSGVRGEASKVKDELETQGFTVGDIGNADNSDYVKTLIQHKKDVKKGYLDKLKEVLGETYELGKNEELPSSASDDVIVIVGSKKAAADTSDDE